MRIRVLGGGWYGCHLTATLLEAGHDVELHEIADSLFAGASGGNPARLHLGFHYPRSRLTRAACQDHQAEFLRHYGHLTRGVPINLYAIAAHDSLVDFGTYCQVLGGEVEFVRVDPVDYGLRNVEGAVLTGERHIVIDLARHHFMRTLAGNVEYGRAPGEVDDPEWDLTIDCTFAANDAENIDRYEPCVTGIVMGPVDRAVTIMDGAFGSVYPWAEDMGLSSLTSAKFTPLSKECRSYGEAKAVLDGITRGEVYERIHAMFDQMAGFWPGVEAYRIVDFKLSIRAMPRSAADARLVDVIRVGERALRVRAGKIDAIFHAARMVQEFAGL
jgi:hypothetical protein